MAFKWAEPDYFHDPLAPDVRIALLRDGHAAFRGRVNHDLVVERPGLNATMLRLPHRGQRGDVAVRPVRPKDVKDLVANVRLVGDLAAHGWIDGVTCSRPGSKCC